MQKRATFYVNLKLEAVWVYKYSVNLLFECLLNIGFTGYCNSDTFEASCAGDDVILMTQAVFGQMRLGRCITEDLGYVGCHGDVLDLLDAQCSGKKRCSLHVADSSPDMITRSNCRQSLLQYLEADYKCLAGEAQAKVFTA